MTRATFCRLTGMYKMELDKHVMSEWTGAEKQKGYPRAVDIKWQMDTTGNFMDPLIVNQREYNYQPQ